MARELPVPVTAKDWQEGGVEASITLVVYGDFQCGNCREAYYILRRLRDERGDDLCLVYRHLPLTDLHPEALAAAKAAEAAGRLGKFWPLWAALYETSSGLSHDEILHCAEQIRLERTVFEAEWNSPASYAAVREDVDGIRVMGIGHTPTIFINGVLLDHPATWDNLNVGLPPDFSSGS